MDKIQILNLIFESPIKCNTISQCPSKGLQGHLLCPVPPPLLTAKSQTVKLMNESQINDPLPPPPIFCLHEANIITLKKKNPPVILSSLSSCPRLTPSTWRLKGNWTPQWTPVSLCVHLKTPIPVPSPLPYSLSPSPVITIERITQKSYLNSSCHGLPLSKVPPSALDSDPGYEWPPHGLTIRVSDYSNLRNKIQFTWLHFLTVMYWYATWIGTNFGKRVTIKMNPHEWYRSFPLLLFITHAKFMIEIK